MIAGLIGGPKLPLIPMCGVRKRRRTIECRGILQLIVEIWIHTKLNAMEANLNLNTPRNLKAPESEKSELGNGELRDTHYSYTGTHRPGSDAGNELRPCAERLPEGRKGEG